MVPHLHSSAHAGVLTQKKSKFGGAFLGFGLFLITRSLPVLSFHCKVTVVDIILLLHLTLTQLRTIQKPSQCTELFLSNSPPQDMRGFLLQR